MDEEIIEYVDDPSLFTRDQQARYLIRLRNGEGERKAARRLGFDPKTVIQYRKENQLFEEECKEALDEAEDEVREAIRSAAVRGEPWAGRGYQSKWGWSDKKDGDKTQVNVFNGLQIEGNPIERMLAIQKELLSRPDIEIEEKPREIDVTLDD